MSWKSASSGMKLCFIALIITTGFMMASYATTYWATATFGSNDVDIRYGLWHECHGSSCRMISYTDGWWRGSQATVTVGFMFIVFSILTATMYIFIPGWHEKTYLGIIIAIFGIIAFIDLIVGICIFGALLPARYESYASTGYVESLSFSFYLAIVANILSLVYTIFAVLDMLD